MRMMSIIIIMMSIIIIMFASKHIINSSLHEIKFCPEMMKCQQLAE